MDGLKAWIHDRALTIVMMALFLFFLAGQVVSGFWEYNDARAAHDRDPIVISAYLVTGHLWESVFENWESEFLQMAVFILLTTCLVQRGSPESRRPNIKELVDADPRRFADSPDAPWPVRRGGWVLRVYENSLGLAFVLMFLISWAGHAWGGFRDFASDQAEHGQAVTDFSAYLASPRFWFESFQNWQSEFLSIGLMVWLAVYLRQRYSPESKPVHAPHHTAD